MSLIPRIVRMRPINSISSNFEKIISQQTINPISLASGISHNIALIDFKVFSWGSNFYGQCGIVNESDSLFTLEDDADDIPTPTLVKGFLATGNKGYTTSIESATNQQIKSRKVEHVASGNFNSFVLDDDGVVCSWGGGILGHPNEHYDSNPLPISYFPSIAREILQLKSGGDITVALSKQNEVYVWGYISPIQKSITPALVQYALKINSIQGICVSKGNGAFAGVSTFGVYGDNKVSLFAKKTIQAEVVEEKSRNFFVNYLLKSRALDRGYDQKDFENSTTARPDYPFMKKVEEIEGVYEDHPFSVIDLTGIDVEKIELGQDTGIILTKTGNLYKFPIHHSNPSMVPFGDTSELYSHVSISHSNVLVSTENKVFLYRNVDQKAEERELVFEGVRERIDDLSVGGTGLIISSSVQK